MLPKPSYLSGDHGVWFKDPLMSAAYPSRPPYPGALIHKLAVLSGRPGSVTERVVQPADCSYQRRTRSARNVFHRLGRPSPSSSMKWTLPGCVFSSSHVPSGCCLERSN